MMTGMKTANQLSREVYKTIKHTGTGFAPHWGSCRAVGSFRK